MYKQITVFLDPKNDPPQYICVVNSFEQGKHKGKLHESQVSLKSIVHPGGTIRNVEEALVQVAIPELEKLFDTHFPSGIGYITIYCFSNSCKDYNENLTSSYKKYLIFIYNPNMIKKLKEESCKKEKVEEKKNTDIILLHL